MPPAFALSQDQTLRFIIKHQPSALKHQTNTRFQNRPQTHRSPSTRARGTDHSNHFSQIIHIRIHEQHPKAAITDISPKQSPKHIHQIKPPISHSACSHTHTTPQDAAHVSLPLQIHISKNTRPTAPMPPHKRNTSTAKSSQPLSPILNGEPRNLKNQIQTCKKNLQRRTGEPLSRPQIHTCQHDAANLPLS